MKQKSMSGCIPCRIFAVVLAIGVVSVVSAAQQNAVCTKRLAAGMSLA